MRQEALSHIFREELKSYFKNFYEEYRDPDGKHIRNYYYFSKKIDGMDR